MPDPARALQSVRMLDLLIEFFDGGKNWIRGDFHDNQGGRCLVGAMRHIRPRHHLYGDPTREYLLAAMPNNWRFVGLMQYNDDHCREFIDLLIVLVRARFMALCDANGLPPLLPVPVVAKPKQPDLPAPSKALQTRVGTAAERWRLILQVERERREQRAAGRATYTLCPRTPAQLAARPEPERLAA